MVLLRANPMEDIANTRAIESVIVDGRFLDRALLDAILAAVEEANDESRTIPVCVRISGSVSLLRDELRILT